MSIEPKTPIPNSAEENKKLPIDIKTIDKDSLQLSKNIDVNDIFNEAVIARPLSFGNALDFKVKRHEYAYRWFNRYGQNGARYTWAKANGFVNADSNDVEVVNEDAIKDGHIMVGDLILMKMPKLEYMGKMRYNHERSEQLINAKKLAESERAKVEALPEIRRSGTDKQGKPKVGIYIPPIGEI